MVILRAVAWAVWRLADAAWWAYDRLDREWVYDEMYRPLWDIGYVIYWAGRKYRRRGFSHG